FTAYATGLYSSGTIDGNLSNSGAINAEADISLSDLQVSAFYTAYISNLYATAYGLQSYGNIGDPAGSLDNSGSISADASVNLSNVTLNGLNSYAYINYLYASASGLYHSGGTITGDVINSGTVSADAQVNLSNVTLNA